MINDEVRPNRRWPSVFYWISAVLAPIAAAVSLVDLLPDGWALFLRCVAAALTIGSLIFKGIGDHLAKEREKSLKQTKIDEENRISRGMADLAVTIGNISQLDDSREREERSVEAAEGVVVSLLTPRCGEVRSCFYRLQWKDEILHPEDDEVSHAFLQRVGSPRGRGTHSAREKFTLDDGDDEVTETIRSILDGRAMHRANAREHKPDRKYGSYLSVPVYQGSEVVGMITADSLHLEAVGVDCEDLLRMIGAFAAIGLRAPLGAGLAALIPGVLDGMFDDAGFSAQEIGE